MSTERNKAIVRQLLADISAWNLAGIDAALAADASWWVAGSLPASGTFDKKALIGLLGQMRDTLMPAGLNISLDHLIAEGDFVAAEGHSDTRFANGTPYANRYHWMFELRDGKVVRAREYLDTQLMKESGEAAMASA